MKITGRSGDGNNSKTQQSEGGLKVRLFETLKSDAREEPTYISRTLIRFLHDEELKKQSLLGAEGGSSESGRYSRNTPSTIDESIRL